MASDTDKLNEECVIKQFAPQFQGTAGLQKATELFEQEARRLQQLGEHPQIPTLLAYFQENNCLYLVQQFIDGQDLFKELQQQGTFSEAHIKDLLQDLLNILKIVHQQKVIHRDIKPENIIRRRDGKIVLIDFGASKQLTKTVMTSKKTIIGSLGYAPLEQMQGGEAYPASDLFSLGVTCFHLLTGTHPWELWKHNGYGWIPKWYQYLKQPLSQELGLILTKMLQVEYTQRYQSVAQVLQDLNSPPSPSVSPTKPKVATQSSCPKPAPKPSASPKKPKVATQSLRSKPAPTPTTYTLNQKNQENKNLWIITLLGIMGFSALLFGGSLRSLYTDSPSPTSISKSRVTSVNNSGASPLYSLETNSDSVNSIAISPDSKTLVSNDAGNTIKLWNIITGKQTRTFNGHSKFVYSVAISPNGKTLASGSGDKTIKLWNIATGKLISTLTGHSEYVSSVAISLNGKTLASGSGDKTIKLWNIATGELIRTLTGHSKYVSSIAISPDGKTLVSTSADSTIKVWNIATGKQVQTFSYGSSGASSIVMNPKGKTFISSYNNNINSLDRPAKLPGTRVAPVSSIESYSLRQWNVATGESTLIPFGSSSYINSLAISPDGKILAIGSEKSANIKLYNILTEKEIRTLTTHSGNIQSLAFSSDGKLLVSSGTDKTIKIWRLMDIL
ncbi:hypothetical protein DSM106972_052390 [Dulcicalothrix desertica PCC 7102]|uniref:Protein kinase domain-containing protein n=1 Tax=Dulcicalothrix desertica PCC 7102 TaxID=232991 RepID=A0A3S1ALK3_9CYAN|nr:hypothetical protein DSM106972_052390 [Dulcicalothrix desertica PCC 7102]